MLKKSESDINPLLKGQLDSPSRLAEPLLNTNIPDLKHYISCGSILRKLTVRGAQANLNENDITVYRSKS